MQLCGPSLAQFATSTCASRGSFRPFLTCRLPGCCCCTARCRGPIMPFVSCTQRSAVQQSQTTFAIFSLNIIAPIRTWLSGNFVTPSTAPLCVLESGSIKTCNQYCWQERPLMQQAASRPIAQVYVSLPGCASGCCATRFFFEVYTHISMYIYRGGSA